MFLEIFRFELRNRFKQFLFYIFFIVLMLITFAAISSDSIQIGGGLGNDYKNSPYNITNILSVMSILGVFIITAFMAGSIIRDRDLNTSEIFYSKPISKFDYLFGRFSASFLISFLIFPGIVIGYIAATGMPYQNPERIGPFVFSHYLYPLFFFVFINVFFIGAISFSLATLTRSMLYTYIGIIVIFVAYGLSQSLMANMDNKAIASLIDPTGIVSFYTITRYWTLAEKNTMLVPMKGVLLFNRIIWAGIGFLLLFLTYSKFRFSEKLSAKKHLKKQKSIIEIPEPVTEKKEWKIPKAVQQFSTGVNIKHLLTQIKIEFLNIVRSIPFIIISLIAVLNIFGAVSLRTVYNTPRYPVTFLMVDALQNGYVFFLFIIVTVYAGELVWRERSNKVHEISDSLPVANWVPFFSKLCALVIVILLFLVLGILTAIGYQIFKGYYNFEISQYLKSIFFFHFIDYALLAVLALFVQTIVNNKYVGHMVMVLYFVALAVLPGLGFPDKLYLFTQDLYIRYSDMNGFGPVFTTAFWFTWYRIFIAAILCLIAILFWVRGTETRLKLRLRLSGQRFGKQVKIAAGAFICLFLFSGSYIFYNTHILNEFETEASHDLKAANYEKKYGKFEHVVQPRITAISTSVDIYPNKRNFDIKGTFTLKNKSGVPIDSLHIYLNSEMKINSLNVPGSTTVLDDNELGYHIFQLDKPLQPADSMEVTFDISYITRGFVNSDPNTRIIRNGTFFNNMSYFPHIGYFKRMELTDKNKRKKYKLPPPERMPSVYDEKARMNTYLGRESDWLTFETVVSTVPEQIAVSPGYLQREWTENGRRYFHYKMDIPIQNFFSFQSAEYSVKKDAWNDVNIEIYYHKTHDYNLDRMIESIKDGLEYFSKNFSPYQHRQFRILEFPRYQSFAQSFPNTVPFSEGIGFIANYENEEDIDMVYYVTAHELAHQWWAHQVIGAEVQGATLMSEALAQYSALMIMEKEYGLKNMRKFLKYELDRYLQGRGGEGLKELPVYLNENQGYIHYNKGSLVMYALRDYIGEENLNRALARYIEDVAYQEPLYTTSIEFLRYIREATPDSMEYIIKDLFETITLFENQATKAEYIETVDGRYKVNLTIETKKLRADSLGTETEIPINDWIYIGVLGEEKANGKTKEKQIYLEKQKIDKPVMEFEIIVDEMPKKAGIDPYSILIDRNWDNNLIKVEKRE